MAPGESVCCISTSASCSRPLAQVWQRRGTSLRVPAAEKDERRAVFGALDYASGRRVLRLGARTGGAARPDGPDKALRTAGAGHGHHELQPDALGARLVELLRRAGHPGWLPVNVPPLTVIERLLRFLTQTLACHHYRADAAGLEGAAGR